MGRIRLISQIGWISLICQICPISLIGIFS